VLISQALFLFSFFFLFLHVGNSELIWCDFQDGLDHISAVTIIPSEEHVGPPPQPRPSSQEVFSSTFPWPGVLRRPGADPASPPIGPPNPPGSPPPRGAPRPPGWIGSLRPEGSPFYEVIQAVSWHNFSPGETRVRLDTSGFVSFYDPALTSLVSARRESASTFDHRLLNISREDSDKVRAEIKEVVTRDQKGSGVDWNSLWTVITDRYAGRLEFLRRTLQREQVAVVNSTETVLRVRQQLLVMLVTDITTSLYHLIRPPFPRQVLMALMRNSQLDNIEIRHGHNQ